MAAELCDGLETYQKDETHAFMMTDSLVLLLIKVTLAIQIVPTGNGRFWRACINATDDKKVPFVADTIIANPPSFVHFQRARNLVVSPPKTVRSGIAFPSAIQFRVLLALKRSC
jgi:hypothetical protein